MVGVDFLNVYYDENTIIGIAKTTRSSRWVVFEYNMITSEIVECSETLDWLEESLLVHGCGSLRHKIYKGDLENGAPIVSIMYG
mgnify:CR=1 FL=1